MMVLLNYTLNADEACGIFSCMAAYCIVFGVNLSYSMAYIREYRLHVLEALQSLMIPGQRVLSVGYTGNGLYNGNLYSK